MAYNEKNTPTMSGTLKEIIAVYPEYKREINQIFHESELFVELVNDYLICKNRLNSHLPNENEYKDAFKELEEELLEQIVIQQKKMSF